MQIIKSIMLRATCTAIAVSSAIPDTNAADECSGLGGTMSIPADRLHEGVSSSDVRKYVEHPLGQERYLEEASLARLEDAKKTPLSLRFVLL